jgi:hypothetical protein
MDGISSTVSRVWNGIKDTISNAINGARDAVSLAIEGIKGLFNFSWKLPDIKVPHFNVSGGEPPFGMMGKGSLPRIGVEWYAKGGIMNGPTVFGMNGNNAMVGGEAGKEAVLPLNRETLGSIGQGIASTMDISQQALVDEIQNLRAIVSEYLPLAAQQKTMVLNNGALVGSIMPEMNKQLGNNINLKGRGR